MSWFPENIAGVFSSLSEAPMGEEVLNQRSWPQGAGNRSRGTVWAVTKGSVGLLLAQPAHWSSLIEQALH